MKLAYSCAGEGFGHVSRMSVLLPHLEKNHSVGLFLPKSVEAFLESKLGPRRSTRIPGIHFVQRRDRVRLAATIAGILPVLAGFPTEVVRIARLLKREGYQAVLSDYEPHLAWAGRLAGLPVFQLNHPGVLTRIRNRPFLAWLGAFGSRLMEGPWDQRVVVSFFDGDVGPLLRPNLKSRRPHKGRTIVVNLKESYRPKAIAALGRIPGIVWKIFPSPDEDFDSALLECAAVVSPAGHQVIAEALALGKPVLAIPQIGQPEQQLNAERLVQTGRGKVGSLETLEQDLADFLNRLGEYETDAPLPPGFDLEDGTSALLERIDHFLTQRVAV